MEKLRRHIETSSSVIQQRYIRRDSVFLDPLPSLSPITVIVIDLSPQRRNSGTANKASPLARVWFYSGRIHREWEDAREKGWLGTQFKYKLNDSPGCLSATRFVEISSMEIRFARTNCHAARHGMARLVAWLLFASHSVDIVACKWRGDFENFFSVWVKPFKLCCITFTNILYKYK